MVFSRKKFGTRNFKDYSIGRVFIFQYLGVKLTEQLNPYEK